MFFLQFTLYSSSFFGIPSKATPGVALEVEQPGIAQLSSGISNLITELTAIRNLTSVRFCSVWFSSKKVCLHVLHLEKDWVEFSAVHNLFNKNDPFDPNFQTIRFLGLCVHVERSELLEMFLLFSLLTAIMFYSLQIPIILYFQWRN